MPVVDVGIYNAYYALMLANVSGGRVRTYETPHPRRLLPQNRPRLHNRWMIAVGAPH